MQILLSVVIDGFLATPKDLPTRIHSGKDFLYKNKNVKSIYKILGDVSK